MKDFGAWFRDFKPMPEASTVDEAAAHIATLEDAGVIDAMEDGSFTARCCCCGEWTELPVGPDEIDIGYEHYCGGSPRCCP